ncbi:MAG: PEGA domain-containing protein [Myxococcota bacterium]
MANGLRFCPACASRTDDNPCSRCGRATLPAILQDRYELTGPLDADGLGLLRAVALQRNGDEVAIRLLEPRPPDVLTRFAEQARTLSEVQHANLQRTLDGGVTPDGLPWLCTEPPAGRPLGQEISVGGKMTLERALSLATQTLKALHELHSAGLVHGNVTPTTVRVVKDGVRDVVKLGGAGAAVLASRTPPPDERADIHAVGLLVYEMLTGALLPRGEGGLPQGELLPVARHRVDLADKPHVQEVLNTLLARRVEDRPVSALHAISVLQKLLPAPTDLSNPHLLALETTDFRILQQELKARSTAAPTSSRSRGTVAAWLAGLACGGVLTAFLIGRGGDRVTVQVQSRPAAARISINGRAVGTTPLRHPLPRGTTPVTITLEKEGFQTVTQQLVPSEDRTLEVELPATPAR